MMKLISDDSCRIKRGGLVLLVYSHRLYLAAEIDAVVPRPPPCNDEVLVEEAQPQYPQPKHVHAPSKSHITRRYRAHALSRPSVCRWRCARWAHTLASLTDVFRLYVPTASAYAVEV
jgi:hypothetical protein